MFTIYHSNQIDVLKSLLVALIKRDPLANPFEQEQILVQSPGMSQWLKMALAQELGVAANLNFPLPATFIWDMFTQVLDDVPARSAFNKEAMTWKIMQLLPEHLQEPDFLPLASYLAEDEDGSKRYQLAEKIADIYDGYLVYRPEWIASWESGIDIAELSDEQPWQPKLWQALYDHTVNLNQSPYHRANLYEHFIDSLNHRRDSELTLPKRLFVFGISSLPPRYLDALKALGQHIDVHLMFTNPCRYYWGDVRDKKYLAKVAAQHRNHLEWQGSPDGLNFCEEEPNAFQLKGSIEDNLDDEMHISDVGNSLLASMGKLGRDNLYLLSQLESHEIEAFVDIDKSSLLRRIQSDILNLEEHQNDEQILSSNHKPQINPNDRSLTIHRCHSAMREVEVLHDNLLAMFDSDPELKPRDIIVMVADINRYSPAIQAVFGNAPGQRYIPFSISDRTADKESPLLNAFNQLLALPEMRCTSSELLELLEVPAVSARFDLNEHDYRVIKQWVEESQIRWGVDESTAAEFDLPQLKQNSWKFGIQRMLAGYAMNEQAGLLSVDSEHIAPYQQVQGMQAEVAGKLAQFIDTVDHFRCQLSKSQSAEHWRATIHELVERLFLVDNEGEIVVRAIRDTIANLNDQLNDARYEQALSPKIVRQYFLDKLSGARVSQRFLAGQVNFCTLMPMRSIPFKTVCLLGMNDGVYPRSMPPETFDLMNNRTKPGDRSRRDDDRYLFLEALLSAQNYLYISYVGRSIWDNTERVPSVLVSELTEYCEQNYCLIGDDVLTVDESGQKLIEQISQEYSMVPFSPAHYSKGDGNYRSYAKEWLPSASQSRSSVDKHTNRNAFQLAPMVFSDDHRLELDLTELQRFWRLPVQYLFNRRLKVSFDQNQYLIDDDEPFALNGLESYQLRDTLLANLVTVDDQEHSSYLQHFVDTQKAQGYLPVGHFGELEYGANLSQTKELAEVVRHLTRQPIDDIEVNIPLTAEQRDVTLQGWLTNVYQSGLVRFRSGRLRANDYLSAWIDHLSANIALSNQRAMVTHMIGYDKKDGVVHRIYPALSREQAQNYLLELIDLFVNGQDLALAYFPETAMAGVEANFSRGAWTPNDEKMLTKMEARFCGGFMTIGEGSNAYIARVWPEWNEELAHAAKQLACRVLEAPRTLSQSPEEFYQPNSASD